MPYERSTFQLPCGRRCLRIDWNGVASGEEAAAIVKGVKPGEPYHGMPMLAVCLKMDRMEAGARAAFGATDFPNWLAIVVTNPIIRVASNFVIRMSRNKTSRLFATVEEAVRWLDERVRGG